MAEGLGQRDYDQRYTDGYLDGLDRAARCHLDAANDLRGLAERAGGPLSKQTREHLLEDADLHERSAQRILKLREERLDGI